MKKFMNSADDFLKESLQGFGAAHQDVVVVITTPTSSPEPLPQKKGK